MKFLVQEENIFSLKYTIVSSRQHIGGLRLWHMRANQNSQNNKNFMVPGLIYGCSEFGHKFMVKFMVKFYLVCQFWLKRLSCVTSLKSLSHIHSIWGNSRDTWIIWAMREEIAVKFVSWPAWTADKYYC